MKYLTTIFFFLAALSVYTQDIVLPAPQHLKGEVVEKNGRYYIDLSWDGKQPGDTLTDAYFIFHNFPPKTELYLNGAINRLNEPRYSFEVKKPYAAEYWFAIRANSFFPYDFKSGLSDTLKVVVPSVKLPAVDRFAGYLSGKQAHLSWAYGEMLDLEGFEINIDKESRRVGASERSLVQTLEKEVDRLLVEIIPYSDRGVRGPERKLIVEQE